MKKEPSWENSWEKHGRSMSMKQIVIFEVLLILAIAVEVTNIVMNEMIFEERLLHILVCVFAFAVFLYLLLVAWVKKKKSL